MCLLRSEHASSYAWAPTQGQVDFALSTCTLNRAGQHGEWHTCPHCCWWSRLQLLLQYTELLLLKS